MSVVQIRNLLRSLVYVTVLTVPLIFWRGVSDAFDLVKGTTLAVLGLAVALTLLLLTVLDRRHIAARPTLILAGTFTAAALITTITSIDPLQSVIGQYQRYTGLVTLLASVTVMLAISAAFTQKQLITLGQVLVVAASGVALYGFIQELEIDPFAWSSQSFAKFVFGTMGNPNTGTAFVGVVSPLTAWAMLRRQHSTAVRAMAGAMFGTSLGMTAAFHSLQGYVACGFAVLFIAAWAWTNGRQLGKWLIAGLAGIFLAFALTQEYTATLWLLILVYAAIFGVIGAQVDQVGSWTAPEAVTRIKRPLTGAAGAVVIAVLVVVGPRAYRLIERELAGSLVERGDFWRAGWAIFTKFPVFGSGLETFGHLFATYRPLGHAVNLEESRTSSVHSIHLGMFSGGGLVLGLAYLALVVGVLWVGARALRRDAAHGSGLLMAAWWAYLGFQVQSSVSVEHVGLHLLHFTLAGLVLALALPVVAETSAITRPGRRAKKGKSRPKFVPTPVIVAGVLLWLVMSVVVISRPLQAAVASFNGVGVVTQRQDYVQGLSELDKAIARAPWEGLWWVQRAEIRSFAGNVSGAADDASEAAARLRYKPGGSAALANLVIQDAQALLAQGDTAAADQRLDRALEIVRIAASNDPLAPRVQVRTADVIAVVADVYRQLGRTEEARTLLTEAATYDPDNARVTEVLEAIDNPESSDTSDPSVEE